MKRNKLKIHITDSLNLEEVESAMRVDLLNEWPQMLSSQMIAIWVVETAVVEYSNGLIELRLAFVDFE